MAISFIRGMKVGAPPKYAGSKKGDPLAAANTKVIDALKVQKAYAQLTIEGKPLPKTDAGREGSTWFYREIDGAYWTTLRYGQLSIPLEGTNTAVQVGPLAELPAFYDAATQAITKGELDEPIMTLQRARSAALKGETGAARKAA
jgi:hypothetical protein